MVEKETHEGAGDDAGALAIVVAESLLDMKADHVRVLAVRELTSITDFMVIATGSGERHVRAMSDTLRGVLREQGREILGSEGSKDSGWIVVDAAPLVFAYVFISFTSTPLPIFGGTLHSWPEDELADGRCRLSDEPPPPAGASGSEPARPGSGQGGSRRNARKAGILQRWWEDPHRNARISGV